jgi:exopolyphosphatase/pppGpp-phosphohydrolase
VEINKELGKDHKNHGIQSVNVNGRSTSNHQIIANACNKHYTSIPDMIHQNINANYCLSETFNSNEKKLSYSFKHVFQNSLSLYYYY